MICFLKIMPLIRLGFFFPISNSGIVTQPLTTSVILRGFNVRNLKKSKIMIKTRLTRVSCFDWLVPSKLSK